MTGFDCIGKAVELFEASLEGPDGGKIVRTVNELARLTGYSVYHFTRLFFAVTGSYPKDYMSGRILSKAAGDVAETDFPLALVAQRAGFPDYETFSRAFKKRFGVPPRRVRDLRRLPAGLVAPLIPKPRTGEPGLASREPEVVEMEERCLAGLPFFIEEGTTSFHAQWETFMKVQHRVSGRCEPETFCQFSSWTDEEKLNGLSVLCALETLPGAVQEPLFTVRRLPAGAYLRFLHTGEVSTLHNAYKYIYGEWFAASTTKPLDCWEFQRYPGGGRTTEICIPIASRGSVSR